MRPEKFWILVVLSLMIAALVLLEISNERTTLSLTYKAAAQEEQAAQFQHQHEVLMTLLQKIAVEARTDPAFASLLQKRGIHSTLSASGRETYEWSGPPGVEATTPPPTPPATANP